MAHEQERRRALGAPRGEHGQLGLGEALFLEVDLGLRPEALTDLCFDEPLLLPLGYEVLLGDLPRGLRGHGLEEEAERLVHGRLPRPLLPPLGLGAVGRRVRHGRRRGVAVEDGPRGLGAGGGELRRGLRELAGGLVEGEAVALRCVGVEAERGPAPAARRGEVGVARLHLQGCLLHGHGLGLRQRHDLVQRELPVLRLRPGGKQRRHPDRHRLRHPATEEVTASSLTTLPSRSSTVRRP